MFNVTNEDCLSGLEELEDNSVDLFIIDPPYLINYAVWDKPDFVFLRNWVDLCVRKLKNTGTMWVFMDKEMLFTHKKCELGLVNLLQEYGNVNMHNWVTWVRSKGRSSSKHLKSMREEIIHFTKSSIYTWNNLKMIREVIAPYMENGRPRGWFIREDGKRVRWTGLGDFMVYSSPSFKSILDKQRHSAQKPYLLIERLLLISSNPKDFIVDPFAGSMVTAIASKIHDRVYLGFEKDKNIYLSNMDYICNNYSEIERIIKSEQFSYNTETKISRFL